MPPRRDERRLVDGNEKAKRSPAAKTSLNANLRAWLPIIIALGTLIAWAAQTDSAQNVKIEHLQIDVASLSAALPKIQESLTRIETRLDIEQEND